MTNQYSQPQTPIKKPLSTGKKVGIGVGAAVALLAIGSAMGGDKDSATAVTTTLANGTTVTVAVPTTTVQAGPKTSFGPGTYLVGSQVEPGQYQAPGGSNCYYERRSDTASDLHGIIANEWSTDKSQQIVTIDPTDVAFKSSGCGQWTRIG